MPQFNAPALGVATSLLFAANTGWNREDNAEILNRRQINEDGAYLSRWAEDAEPGSQCSFYNTSHRFTQGLCSHFAIARMSSGTQATAVNRALECASAHDVDCVLSPEIGLSVPAAFVYDAERGLKMVIAPKLERADPEGQLRTVSLSMPDTGRPVGRRVLMNESVRAHFLEGVSRGMREETFQGDSAFCLQMLRLAFADECWREVD